MLYHILSLKIWYFHVTNSTYANMAKSQLQSFKLYIFMKLRYLKQQVKIMIQEKKAITLKVQHLWLNKAKSGCSSCCSGLNPDPIRNKSLYFSFFSKDLDPPFHQDPDPAPCINLVTDCLHWPFTLGVSSHRSSACRVHQSIYIYRVNKKTRD